MGRGETQHRLRRSSHCCHRQRVWCPSPPKGPQQEQSDLQHQPLPSHTGYGGCRCCRGAQSHTLTLQLDPGPAGQREGNRSCPFRATSTWEGWPNCWEGVALAAGGENTKEKSEDYPPILERLEHPSERPQKVGRKCHSESRTALC